MINVSLQKSSATKDDLIPIRVFCNDGNKYRSIYIEVFNAGVPNPAFQFSCNVNHKEVEEGTCTVVIETKPLELGLYEIRSLRFHDPVCSEIPEQLEFFSVRDYERQPFEVIEKMENSRTAVQMLRHVAQKESELEETFLTAVDVRASHDSPLDEFFVFVFIKGLLLGTKMRFERFEIVPTGGGIDTQDHLNFVNDFLEKRTSTEISFTYSDEIRNRSRHSSPVCVAHFPVIQASNADEARAYCMEKTSLLLLALPLSRGAAGSIFDVVVVSHRTGKSSRYSIPPQYAGNLLTGPLSGEDPGTIEACLRGLNSTRMNQFIARLFMEATREKSEDFQYIRYWQILEILAESRNYDPEASLLDYEGCIMKDSGGKPRVVKNSVNIVFNLLRESCLGTTEAMWKKVNVWFAFRNAVAHCGAVSKFGDLKRKEWAVKGYEEVQEHNGHDFFLLDLRNTVRMLLIWELVGKNPLKPKSENSPG